MTADAERFRILFVCTGNVCRSVIAERLAWRGIRARLGDGASRFAVASAGTAGLGGSPMHAYTRHALIRLGAYTDGFAGRQLAVGDIDAADLILVACAEHRDGVLMMCPRASRRSYLLREFARLAAAVPPSSALDAVQRVRDAVADAARLRGRIPYVEPATDEIGDPAPDPEAFLACALAIDAALRPVLDLLCGGPPAAALSAGSGR